MNNDDLTHPDVRLTTVATTRDVVRAELIRNTLITEGIPCELGGGAQAGFTGALEIEIIVRQQDADGAKKIIDSLDDRSPKPDSQPAPEPD